GTALFDVGKQLTGELRFTCTDETRAQDLGKTLRGVVDLVRAQSIALRCYADLGPLVLEDDSCKEPRARPLDRLRKPEQRLAEAVIRTDEANVMLTCVIPVEVQKLRTEIETQARLHSDCFSLSIPFGAYQTYTGGMTVPSDRYLDAPAKYKPKGQSA